MYMTSWNYWRCNLWLAQSTEKYRILSDEQLKSLCILYQAEVSSSGGTRTWTGCHQNRQLPTRFRLQVRAARAFQLRLEIYERCNRAPYHCNRLPASPAEYLAITLRWRRRRGCRTVLSAAADECNVYCRCIADCDMSACQAPPRVASAQFKAVSNAASSDGAHRLRHSCLGVMCVCHSSMTLFWCCSTSCFLAPSHLHQMLHMANSTLLCFHSIGPTSLSPNGCRMFAATPCTTEV